MIYVYSGAHLFQSYAPLDSENLGFLPDALDCTVSRDVDGLFEVSMTYPVQGHNARSLQINNWIYCDAGGSQGMSYFRIDQISQDISGTITVHGCHASYNSLSILAAPFSTPSSYTTSFFNWLDALYSAIDEISADQRGGFSVVGYTDELQLNGCDYSEPVTLKQAVLDAIKDLDGVYLDYSQFGYKVWGYPASDITPQFRIRYGRDMAGYSTSVDATEFYTYVYPYYIANEQLKDYAGQIFPITGLPAEYQNIKLVKAVDMADYYDDLEIIMDDTIFYDNVVKPWLANHPWNPFPNSVNVETIPQEGNEFELGNVGKVYYTPTQTEITAHVVALTYDVLAGRMTTIGINQREKDVTDTIASLAKG